MLATVALHPNEAPRLADLDEALREIEALAARDRVRGIGETGMDFFRTGDEGRAAQEESFRAHIAIAKRYGKAAGHPRPGRPRRRAARSSTTRAPRTPWCCTASPATPSSPPSASAGATCSASPARSPSAAPRALREAAALTPLDQLLVETDAPYLTPMPHRGRPNASYLIPLTVRSLAETTGADLDELCAAISATGDRVFGPW